MEISFVAVPKGGEPAGALSPADLKLTDNGKGQPVTGLWRAAAGRAPASHPALTFANRAAAGTAQNVSVILLDGVNTEWKNDGSSREETVRALQQIRPEERVAILVLGKSLKLLSDFPDSATLRGARVLEFGSGKSPSAGAGYSDLILPVNLNGRAEMYQEEQRLTSTYAALRSIAAMLAPAPGRKSLMWVSGDFPLLLGRPEEGSLHPGDADADFQHAAKLGYNQAATELMRALQRAGVTVYPVDARRVSMDPLRRQSHVNSITTSGAGEAGSISDIMKYLAEQTGGAVIPERKDLGETLRGALDDAGNAYVLTFAPGRMNPDGAPHRLNLQAKGYQIRMAPVYYPPAPPTLPGDATSRLAGALSSPLDLAGIGITARVEADPSGDGSLAVSLDIDARDLQLARQGEDWAGVIAMGIVEGNLAGEQFGRQLQSGGVTIHAADYQEAMRTGSGIHYAFKVRREPRATYLRLCVIDQKTSNSGSLSVSL